VACLLDPIEIARLPCASALLIEPETGDVLYEQNADAKRSPASLVKMMVELLVFRDLESGQVSLADSVVTSANASTMGGSQVFLKHGEKQTIESLLDAIAIASANDAAMAIAEHLAGSETAFVERMNEEATRLGCRNTRFANVHGLDLWGKPKNVSTARDIATIARALLEYPRTIALSSTWRKPFRGGEFWLDNTNKLLRRWGGCDGLDGLKTGFTPRAGGCLCGTAVRDGVRLVSVIMGARPGKPRFFLTRDLLDSGYAERPRWIRVVDAGGEMRLLEPVAATSAPRAGSVSVAGKPPGGPLAHAGAEVRVLLEADRADDFSWRLSPPPELETPIRAGDALGTLECRHEGRIFARVPARAAVRLDSAPPSASPLLPAESPRPLRGSLASRSETR
jgi:D-alanyl-D-alanine carboxypeptidase (penicillin-binding protein 5/6)